jgi:hypothetical protein
MRQNTIHRADTLGHPLDGRDDGISGDAFFGAEATVVASRGYAHAAWCP